GYQDVLLQGIWPPVAAWIAIAAWMGAVALSLNVFVARSRDQLVDWL
ncbi:ABC transporter, partial [Enterococcus faecalis]|nr:ABC transporter [Enterococcus faecalis]